MAKTEEDLAALIESQMQSVPVPNTAARVVSSSDEKMELALPLTDKPATRLLRRVLPISKEKRVELDRMGVEFYKLCDGRRTIGEIVDLYQRNWKLSFFEARALLLGYLKTLMQRNLILLLTPDEAGRQGAKNDGT